MSDQAKIPEGTAEEPKLQSFKRGDYKLHFFLEEARALMGDDASSTTNPIVLLSCFKKIKSTKALKNIGASVYWGEHFFFTLDQAIPEELNEANLLIEVKDHSTILRDSLIGSYTLDLSYIYSQPNHSLLHKWVLLSNPGSKNYEAVRGYLKFGVSLIHESDKPTDLTAKESITLSEMDILMPPEIKPKCSQIIIRLLKAENLPVLDSLSGTLDAYCLAKIAGTTIKSKVIKADQETLSAYWYESLYMPFIQPSLSQRLVLMIADRDILSPKDDIVGSISFNWAEIQAGRYSKYFWTNLYGAPEKSGNDQAADLMNMIDSLGSHWRGRILLSIECQKGDKAVLASQPLEGREIRDLVENQYEATTDYSFRAMVLGGLYLPDRTGKYSVKVQFCDIATESSVQKAVGGIINWFELLKPRVVSMPQQYDDCLPDLFVYLMYDKQPVCFARLKAQQFLDPDAPVQWLQLVPDRSIGKIKHDWEGGMVGVRIHISSEDHPTDSPDWHNAPIRPEYVKCTLLCNLYQCRNLPAADSSGLSDPYVKIYVGGSELSTQQNPIENTLNPSWYTVLPLQITIPKTGEAPPIWVFVWDWDRIGEDDLIGMCKVDMSEACNNLPPEWRPLNMGRSGSSSGQILISFSLCSGVPPVYSIEPEYEEADIEINVLGLRDLTPALGYLPVSKAFVKFDLKGIRLTGGSLIKNYLQTQPKEPGPNPNINTVLSFSCLLPKNPLYCPALTCTVHDQLFAGLVQPHIGTFSMNLGDFKEEAKQMLKGAVQSLNEERATALAESQKLESYIVSQMQEIEETTHLLQAEVVEVKPLPAMDRQLTVSEAIEGYVLRAPKYVLVDNKMQEVERPDSRFYMEIGYDKVPGEGSKHYRMILEEPLEKSQYYGETPFLHYSLKKGQTRGLQEVSYDAPPASDEKVTGTFKGLVKIIPRKQSDLMDKFKGIPTQPETVAASMLEKQSEFDSIKEKLLVKTKCLIRVYILDAFDLQQKDRNSQSDPFLKVKLGKKVYNDIANKQEDNPNPRFFRLFEFQTTLPGESVVTIQVWDHDAIMPNTKIGSTKIDVEDRYFSSRFMSMPHKPVETCPLMTRTSRRPQGFVRLWVDILPLSKNMPPALAIQPRPPAEYEIRLIVYKCAGVESMDFEGVSDLYVRAFVNPTEPHETDTHFRCQSGKGSWNWRMKFSVALPLAQHRCTLQIWDQDYLSRNDFIAEATFDFEELARQAWETGGRVKKYGPGESGGYFKLLRGEQLSESFWVDCKKRNDKGGFEEGGRVLISFELVPKERAQACLVGVGRDQPNVDPFLPPPVGRFEWSLNPLKMISQFCGPEFKAKICCAICCVICVIMLSFLLPVFFTDAVSLLIFK